MKKVLALCVALLMVVVLAVPAMAAGAFVSSPSTTPAPELEGFTPDSEDCEAQITITAYANRKNLSEEDRTALEEAYNEIVHHTADNPFKRILGQLAEKLNCDTTQLSVSDLFDIDLTNCARHDGHGGFTITLKVSSAAQIVGILHFNGTEWEITEIQNVDSEKGLVTFHGTDFSPFALVVDNGSGDPIIGGVDNEPAPNNTWWIVLVVVVVVLAAGAAVAYVFYKKNKSANAAA